MAVAGKSTKMDGWWCRMGHIWQVPGQLPAPGYGPRAGNGALRLPALIQLRYSGLPIT